MSEFSLAWALSRHRLIETISDLNETQLNWHIYGQALSIGQMAVHVAGVEVLFGSQLLGVEPEGEMARLKCAATDGVVNDKPYPFADSELTPQRVADLMNQGKELFGPIIESASPDVLSKQIVSALGPVITGEGALTRLAFHSAYHQGQAYLIRTAPGFPR